MQNLNNMTYQEAIKLTSDNVKFIKQKVKYDNTIWLFNRFIINKIDINDYVVLASLSIEQTIEFTTPFNADEFEII